MEINIPAVGSLAGYDTHVFGEYGSYGTSDGRISWADIVERFNTASSAEDRQDFIDTLQEEMTIAKKARKYQQFDQIKKVFDHLRKINAQKDTTDLVENLMEQENRKALLIKAAKFEKKEKARELSEEGYQPHFLEFPAVGKLKKYDWSDFGGCSSGSGKDDVVSWADIRTICRSYDSAYRHLIDDLKEEVNMALINEDFLLYYRLRKGLTELQKIPNDNDSREEAYIDKMFFLEKKRTPCLVVSQEQRDSTPERDATREREKGSQSSSSRTFTIEEIHEKGRQAKESFEKTMKQHQAMFKEMERMRKQDELRIRQERESRERIYRERRVRMK